MAALYALVPAAGAGTRMGARLPKQYLEIDGRPLLFHSLQTLARHPRIERVFVVLAPGDTYFGEHDCLRVLAERVTPLYCGGTTRSASVLNGLVAVIDSVDAADWILVHDAVRPCLARPELDRLVAEISDDDTGGLLAVPVADTLKRACAAGRVRNTEPRDDLWLAQTPQMFRYRLLVDALRLAREDAATDEAAAVERMGLKPRLVLGSPRNIKVTYADDLALAKLILQGALERDAVQQ